MTNPEHLALLKHGVEAWNKWRKANPGIKPDLREADLGEADLGGANLREANLHGANLYRTNLSRANLREANLREAILYKANLYRTNLYRTNLSRAILDEAILRGAILRGAILSKAILGGADLHGAILYRADLRGADLRGAIFEEADLRGANLRGADLGGADLHGAILDGANLRGVNFKSLFRQHLSGLVETALPPLEESVLLGASAPTNVRPGEEFTVRFVAYLQEFEEQVDKILTGLSPRSKSHLGLGWYRWEEGVHVTVILSCQYLDIAERQQEFEWHSPYQIISFDVVTQKTAPAATVVLKLDVCIQGIRVASLRLDLQICNANQRTYQKMTAIPATTAFASYASQDRLRVLDCVAALQISAGMDIFQDCLSLHPNEPWKEKLLQEILDTDIFLLFWSKHAMASQWVRWEWITALEKRGEEVIQLQSLDTVEEAPPPPELAHLHFGSPIMRIRKSYEATTPKANP